VARITGNQLAVDGTDHPGIAVGDGTFATARADCPTSGRWLAASTVSPSSPWLPSAALVGNSSTSGGTFLNAPDVEHRPIRAAQGRLGDTVDDRKAQRPLQRWTPALPLLGSLVAVALILQFGERHTFQMSAAPMLEASPESDVSAPAPPLETPTPFRAESAQTDPCPLVEQTAPEPPQSTGRRRTTRNPPPTLITETVVEAAHVDTTAIARVDPKVGVLDDGRRVRLTLE
jgi:hypothetical protein